MAKKKNKQKANKPEELATPDVQLSEDEPSNGYLYLHAPRHMARHDEQMAEAFELLRKNSNLAKRILDAAKKSKLAFLRYEFKSAIKGRFDGNLIRLSNDNNLIEDVGAVIPHELMHWLQPSVWADDDWDINTRLLADLSCEAGAETCAVHVCHQMFQNGYTEPFNHISKAQDKFNRVYAPLYRAFDAAYSQSLIAGNNNGVAMIDGGDKAFHSYFEQSSLVKAYGQDTMETYLKFICNNFRKYYPTPGFGLISAKQQAQIRDDEFLIHDARLPLQDDELFKDNKLLRQAFEYWDLWHVFNHNGGHKTNIPFARKSEILEADHNPFFGLGLDEVLSTYHAQEGQKDSKGILAIMLDLVGASDPDADQMTFDFG